MKEHRENVFIKHKWNCPEKQERYVGLEKERHGTTHSDNASDQISNQSNIQKQKNLWPKLTDVQTNKETRVKLKMLLLPKGGAYKNIPNTHTKNANKTCKGKARNS